MKIMKKLATHLLLALVFLLPLVDEACQEQAGHQHDNYCHDHHGSLWCE